MPELMGDTMGYRLDGKDVVDTETGQRIPRMKGKPRAGAKPAAAFAHYPHGTSEAPAIINIYATPHGLQWVPGRGGTRGPC